VDDDEKKVLEAVARVADHLETEHRPHGCVVAAFAHALGRAARATATQSGPAQVATAEYRNNWDGIFGKKQPRGQA